MDQHIKEEWTQALRSGEYEQGEGALRQDGDDGTLKHCCLGVLCDIVKDRVGGQWREWSSKEYEFELEDEMDAPPHKSVAHTEFLPDVVVSMADLPGQEVEVGDTFLTNHNDGTHTDKKNFDEIADLIEQHL
jgi:hypothetical protein